MNALKWMILLVPAVIACSQETGERLTVNAESYSVALPQDWQTGRELGSLVARPSREDPSGTIAIRTEARAHSKKRAEMSAAAILQATEIALRGLPQVEIRAEQAIDVGGLQGTEFELEFTPHGRERQYGKNVYRRECSSAFHPRPLS